MPKTKVVIYQENSDKVPLLKWMAGLSDKAQNKCYALIERLAENGNDLRRPTCDYLDRNIWELRARSGNVHYRILYAFVGRNVVLLSNGCSKEKRVPKEELDRAVLNLKKYLQRPKTHTYKGVW